MGQTTGKIARRSPTSCPGPNNLPPLQFHTVHGDNIRISRDGTLAKRFESFCRAITFSARPIRLNERVCVKFSEISNNWNGGIRFGFTINDPATLENSLPKYACPDLTNRPGFWAKALHEQYCEKDNILFYYVNSAGDVIYGINGEEKGVILSGIDTRGLLWTLIDIYGNCTGIEFLDARIYMYQQNSVNYNRRQLPLDTTADQSSVISSMQSLNINDNNNINNTIPSIRYNSSGRLIPVPFHITKGRNIRLTQDRFVASRNESDFCQGYVFTAKPLRIGEKIIVQILKTENMYVGALALGLTSCNPNSLQSTDLPDDSDFLLDRPEYWVVSKDIASAPQRGDEISFYISSNGEVAITKNDGQPVVVMHVDQSLQLWAFLDVYGSTQSVRVFRQPILNAISQSCISQHSNLQIQQQQSQNSPQTVCSAQILSSPRRLHVSLPGSDSINSFNSQISENRKNIPCGSGVPSKQIISSSSLSSRTSSNRMISVPSNGDMIQIQPGGTVLVVNLPPAHSDLTQAQISSGNSQTRLSSTINIPGSSTTMVSSNSSQYVDSIATGLQTTNDFKNGSNLQWKEQSIPAESNSGAECTICYENLIDSVLYMCGHMCMCYECAIEQWRGVGGGHCPLCRAVIRDVIRTYTT